MARALTLAKHLSHGEARLLRAGRSDGTLFDWAEYIDENVEFLFIELGLDFPYGLAGIRDGGLRIGRVVFDPRMTNELSITSTPIPATTNVTFVQRWLFMRLSKNCFSAGKGRRTAPCRNDCHIDQVVSGGYCSIGRSLGRVH